jgi:hypothetical protein
MVMKKILLLIILGMFGATSFGCRSDGSLETQAVLTNSVHSPDTPMSNQVTATIIHKITPIPPTSTITTPLPTQTLVSDKTLHFDQGPAPIDFTGEESGSCIGPKEWSGLDIRAGEGLTTYNRTDKALQVWGKQGFRNPSYSIEETSPALYFLLDELTVSPDNEWLYYTYQPRLDLFDVWVVNPKTGKQIQRHFDDVTLAGYPGEYWAGPLLMVFPLKIENEDYNWMAWNPFTNEVQFVSARLPGIGTAIELTHLAPVYDPRTGLVIYPCNECGEDDFRAYHIPTQSVAWGVDFGEDSLMVRQWPLVRSEDGEFTTFYFGEDKLWVVDQKGESVLKAILPSEVGGYSLYGLELSPDGKRLAMFRDSKDPHSPILSILSIEDGKLVNLCAPIHYGDLGWSYDSKHLFYASDRNAEDTESVVGILDTTTGAGWQEAIPEDLVFTGWLKP